MTLLALKTAYEHRRLLFRNMKYVQRYANAANSDLLNETIVSYSEAILNVQRAYLLFFKYYCTQEEGILDSISALCAKEYELERPLLQQFEDALWPYYYALNRVPMPEE